MDTSTNRPRRTCAGKGVERLGDTEKGKGKAIARPKKTKEMPKERAQGPLRIVENAQVVENVEVIEENPKLSKEERDAISLRNLRSYQETQTRWVDLGTLEALGILEDVRRMLENIGLEKVLEMNYPVYFDKACQLISSVAIKVKESSSIEGMGFVTFKVDKKAYQITIKEICEAYGFKQTLGIPRIARCEQDEEVWKLIGLGQLKAGNTKAALIRNPAIRYVHKILASTIFARHEADRVLQTDISLLTNAIKPLFEEEFSRRGIEGYEDENLGVVLAKRLRYHRRCSYGSDVKGVLEVGGFLTPLLMACKVPLGKPKMKTPLEMIDIANLKKARTIGGRGNGPLVYNFVRQNGDKAKVHLPNMEITRLDCLENLTFANGDAARIEEPMLEDAIDEVEDEPSDHELPLGSPRYYHRSHHGGSLRASVENAIEGVRKNQRWNRWNSRSIHNIKKGYKKKMKALEETLSDFKSLFTTFVFHKKSPPRHEDGSFNFDGALEEARRHSISHLPSSSTVPTFQHPRASSYEQGESRKRRSRHVPTPSPGSSDNVSFHLSDSITESPSPEF